MTNMEAKPVVGIPVVDSDFVNGAHYVRVNCANYDAYAALPAGLEFQGRSYGKMGWSSDTCLCVYGTDKTFARASQ